MSDTRRKHESPSKQHRRGPKKPPDADRVRAVMKSNKARRHQDKQSIRKEYLP